MKWTRRDTRYVTLIVMLSAVLLVLLFVDQVGLVMSLVQDDAQQPVKVDGGTLHPSRDGVGVIIDDAPTFQKRSTPPARMEQDKVIRIRPGMTRSELAKALGLSPDDLPPSDEIGVVDE